MLKKRNLATEDLTLKLLKMIGLGYVFTEVLERCPVATHLMLDELHGLKISKSVNWSTHPTSLQKPQVPG